MVKVTDEELISALVKYGSYSKAANELGISTQAISSRLKNEDLRRRYEEAKDSILVEAVNGMKKHVALALNTLTEVMQNKENPATVRVSAADAMLRHTVRYIETVEIENRIKALERNMRNELEESPESA